MLLRKSFVPYAVSILAVAAAIGIRLLLDPLIGTRNPFFTVFLSVVFMAWWGGSGPAWLTSIVGAIAAIYFLLEPRHTFAINQLEHQIALLLFGIVCFATITLFGTLRKARERAAEKSELLRATLASIGDGVITIDKDSLITSMNTVAATLTGWTSNDAQGQLLHMVFRIVNESSREPVENPALRALKEGAIVGLANHTILIAKDGTERSIDDSAAPIRNKKGDVVGCVLVFRDITERRQFERQASERAAAARLLASVVESSEDPIISKSLEGTIESWNASASRLFGYSAEQAVGQNISMLIPADRAEEELQILTQLRAGKRIEAYDTVRVRSDGRPVHVSLTISPIRDEEGRVIGASKIVRDITQRKRAETEVIEAQRQLATTLESVTDGFIRYDRDWRVVYVNGEAERINQLTRDEMLGKTLWELFPDVVGTKLEAEFRRAVAEQATVELENFYEPFGRWYSLKLFPTADGGLTTYVRDITDQKLVADELRQSEARLRRVFESNVVGMIRWDLDRSLILDANDEFLRMTGYSHDDVAVGRLNFRDLTPPEWSSRNEEGIRTIREQGQAAPYEKEYFRKDGSRVALIIAGMRFEDSPSEGMSFLIDITDRKRFEQRLIESEARYRAIGESIDFGVWVCDDEGRNTYASESFLRMVGITQEQCSSFGWGEVLHPDDAQTTISAWKECVRTRGTWDRTHRFKGVDGRWHAVLARGVPVRNTNGQVLGWAGINLDIGRLVEAEEQLRRSSELLTVVIDRSPSGFYIVDSRFCISHMNAGSQAQAFRNVNPAIGRRLDDAMRVLWPEPLASELIAIFRHTLESGEPYRSPGLVSPRADLENVESYEWQLDRITMPDGSFAVVCYYYDTTRLREAEAEARENAEGLRKLTAELSDAGRRKDEFLATLAHELRNPLAPVMNSLGMMKHAISPQQLEQARSTMERQVGQMVRLIDDLLDVSRITRDKLLLKTERVELASIVHHVLEACNPLYQSAGHTLSVTLPTEPIYLNADPTRLAQVFGNLLNNSCKYSERNSKVWLSAQRQGDHVIIRIKDTGIGIPQQMLPKVFDLFTQVHGGMDRSEGGLGIGLSLVKRLVEMHGGTVNANSDGPGKGSEFVVTLPILTTAAPVSLASVPMSQPRTSLMRRILVVDDNRDSAESLALLLGLTGNETQTAHDGMEAVQKAESYRPELILLDIGLPKMNGYEACRAIRQQEWGRDIVIIALTGWGQDEDRRKSKEAGFNGHLVKPVELSQLEKLLAELKKSP